MKIPEIRAASTKPPDNRFSVPLHLRVLENGTLAPVARAAHAHYVCRLDCRYPTYEDELEVKRAATRHDEQTGSTSLDFDLATEGRVRRCLVAWDLHERLPEGVAPRIAASMGKLDDESMAAWKALPPLVRKAVGALVHRHLGGF